MTKRNPSTASRKSIALRGTPVPGAEDRQRKIAGFNQEKLSRSHVRCIGAGGIISNIAPTLCRKGIGRITLLDDDLVEASNLNRQRFYVKDIGKNKALALARNLQPECIAATEICGFALMLQEAIAKKIDLACDVAICGVDNNPARVVASRHFRALGVPVIFSAVSRDGDHGYIFIQEKQGARISYVFPDMAARTPRPVYTGKTGQPWRGDDHRHCGGKPASLAEVTTDSGGESATATEAKPDFLPGRCPSTGTLVFAMVFPRGPLANTADAAR